MWWVGAAVVLAIIETQTTSLDAALLAAAALAGGITAAVGGGAVLQVLSFAFTAAIMLLVVRPVAYRHRRQPPEMRTGVAALIGRDAVVIETVDGRDGRVKIGGEIWTARCYDPSASFDVGSTVQVLEIDGATALVA